MDNELRELQSLTEFTSSINLQELKDYDNRVGKKFGEFSFSCGCGEVHSIVKLTNSHPLNPTVWIESGDLLKRSVYPIVVEKNKILFYCQRGFFTMVGLTQGLFRTQIKSEFFIRREIMDAAEDGFGLFISTKDFNLDFNDSRRDPVPTKELTSWPQLEEALLGLGNGSLEVMPSSYNPQFESAYFNCLCGNRHNLKGQRGDYAMNQPHIGFCVAVLVTSNGKRLLSLCSSGYYCLLHVRPTLPIEWYFRAETVRSEKRSIPILPKEAERTLLPENIMAHIKYINWKAQFD
jgi:hypothetical protein